MKGPGQEKKVAYTPVINWHPSSPGYIRSSAIVRESYSQSQVGRTTRTLEPPAGSKLKDFLRLLPWFLSSTNSLLSSLPVFVHSFSNFYPYPPPFHPSFALLFLQSFYFLFLYSHPIIISPPTFPYYLPRLIISLYLNFSESLKLISFTFP